MAAPDVRRALWGVYVAALKRYATEEDGAIVSRSLVRESDGWTVTEPDPLNTAEVVKALFLLDARGIRHGLHAERLLDALVTRHLDSSDYQVTALALGSAAIGASSHAEKIWRLLRARVTPAVTQSMGLAWALSALCEFAPRAENRADVEALARLLAGRLLANQSASGLFHASASRHGLLRRRRADTTLSSQTYPIAALASYAAAFGVPEAAVRAARCADRLCAVQGPLGQWWWRYHARRGVVSDGYPVYPVNQDGAIPLALGTLQQTLGDRRYDAAIARGLVWEAGANEVRQSLIDVRWAFVARAIEKGESGFRTLTEMYAYQPARFIIATLSDPLWSAEVIR